MDDFRTSERLAAIVDKDQAYLNRKKQELVRRATPEQQMRGLVLEAMLWEGITEHDWFGQEITAVVASEYDDIARGVDVVAVFDHHVASREDHRAVAIDVTTANEVIMIRKLQRQWRAITNARLTDVRYFQSNDPAIEHKGALVTVPKVTLTADNETLDSLIPLWTDDARRSELNTHPIRRQLLEEARIQAWRSAQFAREQNRTGIAMLYDGLAARLEGPLQDAIAAAGYKTFTGDKTFEIMQRALAQVFGGDGSKDAFKRDLRAAVRARSEKKEDSE